MTALVTFTGRRLWEAGGFGNPAEDGSRSSSPEPGHQFRVGQRSDLPGLELGISGQHQGKGVFISLIDCQVGRVPDAPPKGAGKESPLFGWKAKRYWCDLIQAHGEKMARVARGEKAEFQADSEWMPPVLAIAG